jgi:hypothetical protein
MTEDSWFYGEIRGRSEGQGRGRGRGEIKNLPNFLHFREYSSAAAVHCAGCSAKRVQSPEMLRLAHMCRLWA